MGLLLLAVFSLGPLQGQAGVPRGGVLVQARSGLPLSIEVVARSPVVDRELLVQGSDHLTGHDTREDPRVGGEDVYPFATVPHEDAPLSC